MRSHLKRLMAAVATSAVAGLSLSIVTATPAHAICDAPRTIYTINNPKYTEIASNIKSEWADPGFTINYTTSTTATATASVTGTVSFEASALFASASTSIGVTVGGSWAKTDTWSYSATVPKGKQGRVVMYHEGRAFTATKKTLRAPCSYVAVGTLQVKAPRKTGENVFKMQTRTPKSSSRAGLAPGADDLIEEFELGRIPADGDLTDQIPG